MSNREIFIDKLRQLSKEEMLERYVALLNTERLTDYVADLEAKLEESEEELLQKERKIQDLMLCEFVATTLDFNKLSADNCRLREKLADMEANKEKEINRICKTHIEANEQLKQQLAEKDEYIKYNVPKLIEANEMMAKQRAEKEKEIKWLKEEKQMSDNCVNILTKKLKEKDDDFAYINKISKELGLQNFDYEKQVAILKSSEKCLTENLKKTNQDKLDFAIAELEKAKEWLEPKYFDNEQITYLTKIIDQQIKALKEGK